MEKLDLLRKEFQIAAQTAADNFATGASSECDSPGQAVVAESARFVGSVIFNVFLATQTRYKEMGFASTEDLASFILDFATEEMVGAFVQCVKGTAQMVDPSKVSSDGQTLQ